MHKIQAEIERLSELILSYSMERLRMDPPTIDHALPQTTLEALAGQTITEQGLGGEEALKLFVDTLGPACISQTTLGTSPSCRQLPRKSRPCLIWW